MIPVSYTHLRLIFFLLYDYTFCSQEHTGNRSGIFKSHTSNLGRIYHAGCMQAVSYTHLDVYKRQEVYRDNRLEGHTMVYYPDGAIHLARSYSDGKLDGTLLQYLSLIHI